jgi:hypothetical protein
MPRIRLWNTPNTFTLVDNDDFEWLSRWRFFLDANGYAATSFGSVKVRLHALLVDRPANACTVCDHRSGDTLDNRRSNLRIATYRQNAANARRKRDLDLPRGVRPSPSGKRWIARIGANGRHVGSYPTIELAARARDEAAKAMFGGFAILNYPTGSSSGQVDTPSPGSHRTPQKRSTQKRPRPRKG